MTGPQQSPPSSVPQDDDQQQQPQKQPQQQQQAEQPSPHKGCELALTYQPLTPVNLHELKRLNSVALPIPYPDSWYQQILVENSHPACTFLAYHRDRMVGGLVTRIDALQPAAHPMMTTMGVPYLPPPPPSSSSGLIRLYIMVICVHAPYRRSGVGSAMLQRLIDTAQQDPRVTDIQLHVHVGNRDALSFYKRHGFAVVHTVPNYYYKLSPPDGYLLSLPIQHQQQQQQQQQPSPPRPQTQPQSHPQYQPPFHAPPYAAPSPLFPQQPYGGFAQYGYGAPQYGGFVPYAQQQQPFMS